MAIEFKDLTIYPLTDVSWRGAYAMIDPEDYKVKYVMDWMKENDIYSNTTVLVKGGYFYMGEVEDALAFKLRWL